MLHGTLPEALNFVELPSIEQIAEYANPASWTVQDGKVVAEDLGSNIRIFIGHEEREVPSTLEEGGEPQNRIFAYPIIVPKQAIYSSIVDYAEKQEYNESEVNCINRRGRKDPKDELVVLHDSFIEWVMQELHKIGY